MCKTEHTETLQGTVDLGHSKEFHWKFFSSSISLKVQWSSAATPSTAYYLRIHLILSHVQQNKINQKKTPESQLNFFNSSWISFSISSLKLTKSTELGKRWGLQGRKSFLQRVFQAHLHFTVVLSWDRKSIQNVNLLNRGVYKRQWEYCGVKKKKKKKRHWMSPAVPQSLFAPVSLLRGCQQRGKLGTMGCPSPIYINICVASTWGQNQT